MGNRLRRRIEITMMIMIMEALFEPSSLDLPKNLNFTKEECNEPEGLIAIRELQRRILQLAIGDKIWPQYDLLCLFLSLVLATS